MKVNDKASEAQDFKYNEWLARDFLLDKIDREKVEKERLLMLYNHLQLLKEYDEELGLGYDD